jgi:SAM-dependent methyltransferase
MSMPRFRTALSNPLAAAAAAWRRLPWPLPAALAWASGWVAWLVAMRAGSGAPLALVLAALLTLTLTAAIVGARRRFIAAAGFPLSAVALGLTAPAPAWVWLVLLVPVLAAYPVRAWRDAPFFPTPAQALEGLDFVVGAPQRVLDAGCGMGHGLTALRRLWPSAELSGVEWSPLLAWASRLRGHWDGTRAQVRRGDMWAASWASHDLVYVFQRPESMARIFEKAKRELAASAWLVSLEFPVPGEPAWACLQGGRRRPVWIYRPASTANSDSIGAPSGR